MGSDQVIRVIVIEDNPVDAMVIKESLGVQKNHHFDLVFFSNLDDGIHYLINNKMDICLLDLLLPDSHGIDTFQRLHDSILQIPIVILSSVNDENIALQAVREGAQDYLIKGSVDGRFLARTLYYAIERHKMQEEISALSLLDKLTGLYNRRGFWTLAEQQLRLAQRKKSGFYLFFADLDGLKTINDTFGHQEGDYALICATEILKETFRKSDILARIGGDEFIAIAIDATQGSDVIFKKRLENKFCDFNQTAKKSYPLSMTTGIAYFDPLLPLELDALIYEADQKLIQSKKGRSLKGMDSVPSHKKQ